MRKAAPGYYLPTAEELKELWQHCTFVFDANVLLNLYSYDKSAKDDFVKLLRSVKERVWIPHQVALEFQRNRLRLLADKKGVFFKAYNAIDASINSLMRKLDDIELTKRHPTIKLESHLKSLKSIGEKLRTELEKHEKEQPSVRSIDEIREALDSIFDEKVGQLPEQAYLDNLYKEGEQRYKNKIPPGYMDRSKDNDSDGPEYFYGGLRFERKYGDLLIWKQMLSEAKERAWQYLIFVTDDAKEDWWQKVDAQGEKLIGPRPELLDEMYRHSDVLLFHQYNSADFMRSAREFLGSEIEESSIEEANKVATEYFFDLEHVVPKSTSEPWFTGATLVTVPDVRYYINQGDNRFKNLDQELHSLGVTHVYVYIDKPGDKIRIIGLHCLDSAGNFAPINAEVLRHQTFDSEPELKGFISFITDIPHTVVWTVGSTSGSDLQW